MRNGIHNLRLFDEGDPGQQQPAQQQQQQAQQQPAQQPTGQTGGQSADSLVHLFEQFDATLQRESEKKARSTLASLFRQHGTSEGDIASEIEAFKAWRAANTPSLESVTKERDEARAELEGYKRNASLASKGVRQEDIDYVSFQVGKLMAADKRLTFDKAAEQYLKDNPRYAGGSGYTVQGAPSGQRHGEGSDGSGHAAINAELRRMLGM